MAEFETITPQSQADNFARRDRFRNRRFSQRDVLPGAIKSHQVGHEAMASGNISYSVRVISVVVSPETSRGNEEYTDIQKAIDYVNKRGGGTVFIKAGTYEITTDIFLYSNITLSGESNTLTVFDFKNGGARLRAEGSTTESLTHVSIQFIKFTNRTDDSGSSIVVNLSRLVDSEVKNCYFINNGGVSGDPQINAIYMNRCERVTVSNNKFETDMDIAIIADSFTTHCVIKENYFKGAFNQPGVVQMSGDYLQFINNFFDGVANRAFDLSGDYCTISNNTIQTTGGDGFDGYGNYNSVIGNIFQDIDGGSQFGIRVNGNYYIVSNNVVTGFNRATVEGIVLDNDANGNLVSGNVVRGCTTGILVDGADDNDNLIHGNSLLGNTTPYVDHGTNTTAADNKTT